MKFIKKHLKLIVFILTFLAIYLIYIGVGDRKIVYTSLGDGFSNGLNPYLNNDYAYSDFLADYLKKNNRLRKFYNGFSDNNMMIKDLKNDILINIKDKDSHNLKQVLRETDLLTISVGINDFRYYFENKNNLTDYEKNKILTEIVEKLDDVIKEIKKYCQGDVYLIGYYNFYPQNSVEKKLLDKLNEKYKQICSKNNITFVDNNNINKNINKYLENPNTIYPNKEGYKEIFNNIVQNGDF